MNKNQIEFLGQKLAFILRHENVEQGVKHAVEDIIENAFQTSSNVFISNPEIIPTAFPLIIGGLPGGYDRAIVESLEAIIKTLETNVEDVDFSADGELQKLAAQISSIIQNDALPLNIYNALANELNELPDDLYKPENVLRNLEILREGEDND